MNKKYSLIFTITAAAVLISSIAYASKKKLHTKPEHLKPDMSEVDLAANLLDANEGHKPKSPGTSDTDKLDEKLKDLTITEKPRMSGIRIVR